MASSTQSKRTKDTTKRAVQINADLFRMAQIHSIHLGAHGARKTIELALTEFFARNGKKQKAA